MSVYPLATPSNHLFGVNGHWIGRDVFEGVPFTARGYFTASGYGNENSTWLTDRAGLGLYITSMTSVPPVWVVNTDVRTADRGWKAVSLFGPSDARNLSLTIQTTASASRSISSTIYGESESADEYIRMFTYPSETSYNNLESISWSSNGNSEIHVLREKDGTRDFFQYTGGTVTSDRTMQVGNNSNYSRSIRMSSYWHYPVYEPHVLHVLPIYGMPNVGAFWSNGASGRLTASWSATGLAPKELF